jgi:malate dehydrogenase (oxaloacetate-decarboxylating)
MLKYHEVRDSNGNIIALETSLAGAELLETPKLNKGTAFTKEERLALNLLGKLPEHIEDLEEQLERTYAQYLQKETALQKNIYLNSLNDTNETLFYALVRRHLEEMLPIIYTPTVGEAVQKYSLELRRSRGLYISYQDKDRIEKILDNRLNQDVDLMVVTDGEGVLGIGDQGIGGMDISIAKLMVYTLCAGVHPHRRIPIQLDVGTNNEKLLNDPLYLGWRHPRLSGSEYDNFIQMFVEAVKKKFPGVYLHWEDFGRDNARKNLNRFRQDICSFNDDIQGTGAVALASVLAGVQASGVPIQDQKVVVMGAGTAGAGIADQIFDAMVRSGLSESEARSRFYLIDREGLLMEDMPGLMPFQKPYARKAGDIAGWKLDAPGKVTLGDTVRNVHPTILIGCSTVAGAFSEAIVKDMAAHTERPLIMPLSNPTSKAEAHPLDVLSWTNGKALIATGSPFGYVDFGGKKQRISQCNNALVFPGLGLGVIISKAKMVSDDMLWAACRTLSEYSPAKNDSSAPLLPDFENVEEISKGIALAVAEQACSEGLAGVDSSTDFELEICRKSWKAQYYPYRKC